MRSTFTAVSLGVLSWAGAFGQAAPGQAPTKFEVASVKASLWQPQTAGATGERGPIGSGGCPTTLKMDKGRVDVKCATLSMLIGYAYRFPPDRITAPDWMGLASPRFDIVAAIPNGASENQVPEMFQALLADRFKLVIHRSPANQSIYALVVEKGGLKMKASDAAPGVLSPASPTDPDAPPSVDSFYGNVQDRTTTKADGSGATILSNPRMGTVRQTGDPYKVQRWEAASISSGGLADLLDKVAPLPLPVMDMTGLKGRYQMVLEVSLSDLPAAHPAIARANPTAVENVGAETEEIALKAFNDGLRKVGLRLERRRGPVETLIVDHVEKTPTEN